MSKLPIVTSLASLTAILFAGCSGDSTSSAGLPSDCGTAGAMCVIECNLGCTSSGGCTITDIAPNQPLSFLFSSDVDPRSVNFGSFSIKTPTGIEPVGEFFVSGNRVDFVPTVRSRQGGNTFGFVAGETYLLTIPASVNYPTPLTSTSGDRLFTTFSCVLRITRPVIDLDGRPPAASLETPSAGQQQNAPRNSPIVLRFSEILDAAPFGDPTGDLPIEYNLHRTLDDGNGNLICNLQPDPFVLPGAVRLVNDVLDNVTRVEFQPSVQLPGASCIEVVVTSQVRDLAGTAAEVQTFTFITESAGLEETVRTFDFQNSLEQDLDRSAGDPWQGGSAPFVTIGGGGELGDFDFQDGTQLADGTYVFSTDDQFIPRKATGWANGDRQILDGVFDFTKLEVPAGRVVRFEGSNVARIRVRGACLIRGSLLVNGRVVPGTHRGKNSSAGPPFVHGPGQEPLPAGAFGALGGAGAWACDGLGAVNPGLNDYDGFDGEDMNVPGSHVYSGNEVDTRGRGSELFPSDGLTTSLSYGGFGGIYAKQAAAGGGGAGFRGVGAPGTVINAGSIIPDPINNNPADRGPDSVGGIAFSDILVRPAGPMSSEFYLVGGSGGGGGASHALFAASNNLQDRYKFWSGGAGGSGGGALWLRVGGNLTIGSSGSLEARGGDVDPSASSATYITNGAPAPGGGGSGGSLLVQFGGSLDQGGTIDVTGGVGGIIQSTGFQTANLTAGDGAPGMFRIETPDGAPALVDLGTTAPAAIAENVGVAEERDSLSGIQSIVVTVPAAVFPPFYLRYEVDALVNGSAETFSDDANAGARPADFDAGAPIQFLVQGIAIDPVTGRPDPDVSPGPWRETVGAYGPGGSGLNTDGTLGYRWAILIDVDAGVDVEVQQVRIVYRL